MISAPVLLAALVALGSTGAPRHRGLSRTIPKKVLASWNTGAAGWPTSIPLCQALATSELTGAMSFCMNNDGSMDARSALSLSSTGSPATHSISTCPNGPSCTAVNTVYLNGTTQYFSTGSAMAPPTGDFSGGVVVRPNNAGSFMKLLAQDDGTSNRSWALYISSGLTPSLDVFKSGGASTSVTSSTNIVSRARHFISFSYDYVADGSSLLKLYLDGTLVGSSAVAVGPANPVTNKVYVATWTALNQIFKGNLEGAFMTEQVLDATAMARIGTNILGAMPTDQGGTLSPSRITARTCASTDGTALTTLQNNRPCVRNGGPLEVEPAATNLVIRSEELNNAAWTATNVTVAAFNSTTQMAPDDSDSMESLQSTVAGGYVESTVFVINATRATASVHTQTTSSTQAGSIVLRDTTAGVDRCTANFTSTTTFARQWCASSAIVSGNNHVIRLLPGGAGTGTQWMWGAMAEAWGASTTGTYTPSSYIRTQAASVTRNGDSVSIGKPSALGDAEGCVALTFQRMSEMAIVRMIDTTAGAPIYSDTQTTLSIYDGTTTVSVTVADLARRTIRVRSWWRGATMGIEDITDGVSSSGAYDGTITASIFYLGNDDGSSRFLNGAISDVVISGNADACQ